MTQPRSRPGGRSARTRAAAFEAAAALIAERDPATISMADIAARAGLAVTSLYRRWGETRTLLMEVAIQQLTDEHPLPDTGTLRGDLRIWAQRVAAGLRQPQGPVFFRVLVATAGGPAPSGPSEPGAGRSLALRRRLEQIGDLLARASARGEAAPSAWEVTDYLLAPLFMRALFGVPADEAFAGQLVDRLMAGPRAGLA